MRIHFDGDIVVYRAGFAAEKARYYLPDESGEYRFFENKKAANDYCEAHGLDPRALEQQREVEPVENALHNAKSIIENVKLACASDDLVVYLSGPTNFREGIATIRPYKGNRDELHKPVHGPAIKEYLEKKYSVVWSVDEEADDVLAYSHYKMWLEDPYSTVLASTDKDLNMVPGLHYNFVKDERYEVTEEEGLRWFYTQLVTGDTTDNIPGVPGKGPKAAEVLLADLTDEQAMYDAVLALYVQGYEDGPAALLENARLLWMRREPNEWWKPPTER